jgi:hypothetical protein
VIQAAELLIRVRFFLSGDSWSLEAIKPGLFQQPTACLHQPLL